MKWETFGAFFASVRVRWRAGPARGSTGVGTPILRICFFDSNIHGFLNPWGLLDVAD
jgi:hypothetical protein